MVACSNLPSHYNSLFRVSEKWAIIWRVTRGMKISDRRGFNTSGGQYFLSDFKGDLCKGFVSIGGNLLQRHLSKHHAQLNDNFFPSFLLNDKEYIALVVDCTICGFFRYFRSNKPEGGRTIARTNLTKNEFL